MAPMALTTDIQLAPAGTAPLRAFIYGRNSVGKRGSSTRDQNTENRRTCERNGWTVAGEFADRGISASRYAKKEREDYQEMIKRMRAGECDVLVVWESSRAYRTLETYVELRALCESTHVLLCYNGRVYDMSDSQDRRATARDALDAESGADEIRERNLRTKRLSAERGAPDGKIPYGYRREYDPETGHLIRQVAHELQAVVVREIFTLLAAGSSVHSVKKGLNDRGEQAPGKAARWIDQHVYRIAINRAYLGKRIHQGVVVGLAEWEPLVDEALFLACDVALSAREHRARESKVKYQLSGLIDCSNCAPSSTATVFIGINGKRADGSYRMVYTCEVCHGVTIGQPEFDLIVESALLAHVSRPEYAAALREPHSVNLDVQEALAEVAALEAQLAEARTMASTLVDGRMELSVASLVAIEARLIPLIEAAGKRAAASTASPILCALAGPQAPARWAGMELSQRRIAIRELMQITIYPCKKGTQKINLDRYSLAPLTP